MAAAALLEAVARGEAVADWAATKAAVRGAIEELFARYNREHKDDKDIPGLPPRGANAEHAAGAGGSPGPASAADGAQEADAAAADSSDADGDAAASADGGVNGGGSIVPPRRQSSPPLTGSEASALAELAHGASGTPVEHELSSSTLPSSPGKGDPGPIATKPAIRNDEATVLALQRDVFDLLESHTSPPFTLQRLCEVLCEPERYYQTAAKLSRGVRKILQVDPQFNAFTVPCVDENGSDELFEVAPPAPALVPGAGASVDSSGSGKGAGGAAAVANGAAGDAYAAEAVGDGAGASVPCGVEGVAGPTEALTPTDTSFEKRSRPSDDDASEPSPLPGSGASGDSGDDGSAHKQRRVEAE